MVNNLKESLVTLKENFKALQQEEKDKNKAFKKFLNLLSDFLQKSFGLEEDEVSILITDKKESIISFVKPDYLVNSGMIPLTSQDSVAAQALNNSKAKVLNHIKKKRHSSIFEYVKHPAKTVYPVQKLMAVPLLFNGKKYGVIEMMRKGLTPSDSGQDWTEDDLKKMVEIVKEIASFFAFFKPEDYKPSLVENEK
jgi:GAF domain-containing protein